MDPLKWAKDIVANVGWKKAYMICTTTGRSMIGSDNDIPNPHGYFYKMANAWIKKHAPSKELE